MVCSASGSSFTLLILSVFYVLIRILFIRYRYPYGTYAALAANIFLIFFQGYTAFLNPFSATDFVIDYILLPVFVLLVLGWKLLKRTKWVRLEDMDIWTGRREEIVAENEGIVVKEGLMRRAKHVVIG